MIVCNNRRLLVCDPMLVMPMTPKSIRQLILSGLSGRSIAFVGMMGSGKSAIGRLVASELDLPCYDSDREIESAAGMTIPEIFSRFGEAYFRSGEQRVIARLLGEGPAVLSLGGGAYMNEETQRLIAERAIAIWLKADVELLMKRVSRRPNSRPLLQNTDLRERLAELVELRSPVYAQADLQVISSRLSKKKTCNDAIRALYEKLKDEVRHG
jgi:shikimate kinase